MAWEAMFCVLEWHAQSPDLNPIEHIWALLEWRLNSYSSPPSCILQLWVSVQEVCDSISLEECRGLYASMPDRIVAVLAAIGRWRDLHCSAETESMYTLFFNIFIYFVVFEIMILSLQWCVELYTLQFLFS
jgi:hypothetical protein